MLRVREKSAYSGKAGMCLKVSLFLMSGIFAILSDNHTWARGALLTFAVFSLCLFPFRKELRASWFWQALAILIAIHAIVLWLVVPFFAGLHFYMVYALIFAECLLFLNVLKQFDPLHCDR